MDPNTREVFDCVMLYMYEEDIIQYYERLEACRTTCKDMMYRFKDVHKKINSIKEMDFYLPILQSTTFPRLPLNVSGKRYVLYKIIRLSNVAIFVDEMVLKRYDRNSTHLSIYKNYVVFHKHMQPYVLLKYHEDYNKDKEEFILKIEQRFVTSRK